MKTLCPFCFKKYEVDDEFLNQEISCPNCNQFFQVQQTRVCPACQKSNLHDATFCRQCNAPLPVQLKPATPVPVTPVPVAAATAVQMLKPAAPATPGVPALKPAAPAVKPAGAAAPRPGTGRPPAPRPGGAVPAGKGRFAPPKQKKKLFGGDSEEQSYWTRKIIIWCLSAIVIGAGIWGVIHWVKSTKNDKCRERLMLGAKDPQHPPKFIPDLRCTCPNTASKYVYCMVAAQEGRKLPFAFCMQGHMKARRINVLWTNGIVEEVDIPEGYDKPSEVTKYLLDKENIPEDTPAYHLAIKNAQGFDSQKLE